MPLGLRVVEPLAHGCRNDAAHPVDRGQLVCTRSLNPLHRPEVSGQGTGSRGAHVADRQRDKHPPQGLGLGLLHLHEQPLTVGGQHPTSPHLSRIVTGLRRPSEERHLNQVVTGQ